MTPREQDAYIATHLFHLDVLGWAYADCHEGCGWESWSVHVSSREPVNQPIFLNRCVCDHIAKTDARINAETPGLNWVEPKIFGHCSICLRVVPFYGESHADAWAMEEKIFELMLWEEYTKYLIQLRIGATNREANALYHMGLNNVDLFLLAHASPKVRAEACANMLQERESTNNIK